jgi:hypothetical protein
MIRLKWYRFVSFLDAERLYAEINKTKFTQGASDGFQISIFRKDKIEAKYIERIEYDEVFEDPFGDVVTTRRVVYKETKFKIFFDSGVLEVVNPGRSLSVFIMKLGAISGFSFSIEPIVLDVKSLTDSGVFLSSNFQNTAISISQVDLGGGASAKITAVGGKNLKESVETFVGGRSFNVSSLTFKSISKDLVASFVITRDGGLKAVGRDSNLIVDLVRVEVFANQIKLT